RHLVEGQDAPEDLAVRADIRGLERDVIYADDGLLGRDERRSEVADRSEEASRVGAWLGPGYGRRLPLDDSQPQPVRVLENQVLSSQPVRCYVGDVRFRESRAPALQRAWRYAQGGLARARRAWVPGAGTGPGEESEHATRVPRRVTEVQVVGGRVVVVDGPLHETQSQDPVVELDAVLCPTTDA